MTGAVQHIRPQTASAPSLLPQRLVELPRWLVWKSLARGTIQKPTKVPYYVTGVPRAGPLGSSDDVASLATYSDAMQCLRANGQRYSGLGFALLAADGVGAIDLDNCLDDAGRYNNDVARRVAEEAEADGCYIERSPSGRGVRILGGTSGFAALVARGYEAYCEKRYVTVTGEVLANAASWGIVDRAVTLMRQLIGAESQQIDPNDDLVAHAGFTLPEKVREGERNQTMLRYIGHLRGKGHDERTIVRMAYAANARAFMPPLPDTEVASLVSRYAGVRQTQPQIDGDVENARRFACAVRDKFVFNAATNRWMAYADGLWSACERDEEMRAATEVADALLEAAVVAVKDEGSDAPNAKKLMKSAMRLRNARALEAMLQLARAEIGMTILETDLDKDPWLLNCRNGVIDLRIGALLGHDPSRLQKRRAEAAYRTDAECPTWKAFLHQTFEGDYDTVDAIQRFLGYSLTGDVSEEKFAFAYGSGANGKSVFANVIASVMGTYCMTAPTSMLEVQSSNNGARPDLARLAGARLVLANETAEGRAWDSQTIKNLVSTERITARYLYGELFEFWPTAKILVRGNHKPVIRDSGDGIWRRVDLWPFERQVPERSRDPHLGERLLEERDGILAWMVEGCRKWRSQGGLMQSKRIREASAEYRRDCDVLGQWIDERCVTDSGVESELGSLYDNFRAWAQCGGLHPMSKPMFGRRLADRGLTKRESNGRTLWLGLGVRPGRSGDSGD